MADITIESINNQEITIGTEGYELPITITGDPTSVEPTGNFEGFYHSWDASAGVLTIKSEMVSRLVLDAIWTINASKTGNSAQSEITYSVVLGAPIIDDPGDQTIYKGILFGLDIDIDNFPLISRVSGLQTAMQYTPSETGVKVEGILPRDAVLTETSFVGEVYTENDGGDDTVDVTFDISDGIPVFLFNQLSDDELYRINPDGTLAWTSEALTENYNQLTATSTIVYLFQHPMSTLAVVNIVDGMLAWTYEATHLQRIMTCLSLLTMLFIYSMKVLMIYYRINPDGTLAWTYNAPTAEGL